MNEPAEDARLGDLVRSVVAMLRRRWLTIALVSAVIFGASLVLVMLAPPKYEAVVRVRLDPSRNPLASASEEQTSLASEAIETEVTELSSPELAREVVRSLGLQNDPEFNRNALTGKDGTPYSAEEQLNRVTSQVLRKLSVSRDKLTYIIAIQFEAREPVKAASIANAFAKTYIDTRINARVGTATRQASFFRKQLAEAAAALSAAQQRVAQYRAQNGIVEGGANGTITDQQVAPLSGQLATAEAQAAEARSNLVAARQQVARGGLDAVSAVRTSTVVSDLRRQLAEVQRNRGEIEARYGPKHPESIKVREQIDTLETQIKAEAGRAVGSLQATADAANAQVASLRGTLNGLKSQQASNVRASATAASLDQDVANKKQAYDRLSEMSLQSTQSQRNQIAQAEVVDAAQPPTVPAPPRKSVLAALALVVAVALGLAVAIVQELLSGGIRSSGDVETRFGLPVLAAIPRIKTRDDNPSATLLANRTSMYAEAYRNARSSLIGVRSKGQNRVVAITSAIPEEGKSTAALSLARVSAMAGARTLLIDCDVRRAKLGEASGAAIPAGLVEVMHGEADVMQAIVGDVVPNLDMLLVKESYFTAEDLFGGGALTALLDRLRPHYPLIVLDLPPVVGLADARTLAAQADVVALAIRWASTPVSAVSSALSALRADGIAVEGVILTMVDPKAEAIGGLYYSGKYAKYYTATA